MYIIHTGYMYMFVIYWAGSKISTSDFHGGKSALDTGVAGTSLIF